MNYEALREALLTWFQSQGRELSWRTTRDPYRVWTAETILQQTQIKQAGTYLTRFWGRFPTLEALAKAPIEAVLAIWQGLGYYQRAHNLHKAAQLLYEQGGFPLAPWEEALQLLESLPGIGSYTARAILAFAGEAPLLPVDGNVVRILSRLWAEALPASQRRLYQQKADALPSAFKGREVSFALMDLGQLVCRPIQPRCPQCPLKEACLAFKQGTPALYPPQKPSRPRPIRFFRLGLYYTSEAVWLEQRPSRGLWGGLWCLPMEELSEPPFRPAEIRHDFTHFRMEGYVEKLSVPLLQTTPLPWKGLTNIGIPTPIRRYLSLAYSFFAERRL